MSFKKVVLITGSSNGFGYLTALTLARKGNKVWASMRDPDGKNVGKKSALLKIAEAEKLDISVLELDVTSGQSVSDAVNKIIAKDEAIDVLVNNAGIMYVGITEAFSLEQAKDQMDVNFFGVLRTVKAVVPYMRKVKKGLIINVTSLGGRLTFPYFGIYCASKHAIESYSQSLRYELSPFGIEVCIVEPGPFGTGLLYSGPKESDTQVFEAYDTHKEVPTAMLKNFEDFYASENALDPQLVADDITKLVEADPWTSEIRTVSGYDYRTKELNILVAPIQESLVTDSLQMGYLLSPPSDI